jgi:glycosyltransferase involved in cell wall biosynthesis
MNNKRITAEDLASPYPLDLEMAENAARSKDTAKPSIYFDGVFKGDYSLAIVNRCLAEALLKSGVELACYTPEPHWQTDPLLNATPSVRGCMKSAPPPSGMFDVHIRNTWPPATRDMIGRFNAYVCFAWEESDFPADLVERFNRDLDLVMVASTFVKRALVHSGVTVPIEIVGEGADHVLSLAPPVSQRPPGPPRLLHVSSGFSRKGVDCLIQAYRQSFSASDNVELVIKTFSNPNNAIPKLIADLGNSDHHPPIHVIDASYTYPELLGLYRTATALIAPSRGEGFGLPLAEAMTLGVPVVTTNYSGQVDFCRPNNSWLVDYTLAASRAHVSGSFSVWAEPDVVHLGQQMWAVLMETGEVSRRSARAKAYVQNHLTWSKTAKRVLFGISKHRPRLSRGSSLSSTAHPVAIDVVTSWGRNCGIATYASHLYGGTVLSQHVSEVLAQQHGTAARDQTPDDARVSRIWGDNYQAMLALAARLEHGTADVLWIQHHPGYFSVSDMHALTESIRKSDYKTRVITLHSVAEAARGGSLAWCNDFDIAFVHSADDAEALSRAGHRNPVVIPHGFLPVSAAGQPAAKPKFEIGSFGFLTPHKNIDLLVRAFALARQFAPDLKLNLFNCTLPDDRSRSMQVILENFIRRHGLDDAISRNYEFIPEHRLTSELSKCDLFVFPYGETNETATGAARIALSANRPILCSQSAVLRDLHPVSHVLKELSVECLAEALISLSQSVELLSLYDYQRAELLRRHSYEQTAIRYLGHIIRTLDVGSEHRYAA